jgi:hypothetical protein
VSFVQTISFTTTRIDELQRLSEEFDRDNPTAPGLVRIRVLKDRDRENAYLILAEFETYELAMENSNRPETGEFARRMGELLDTGPEYGNYDVVTDQG